MALAGAAAAVVAVAPLQPATAACAGQTSSGDFTVLRTPVAPVLHAVSPSRPSLLYVTDGRVLHRSTDGGCSWRAVLTLPSSPGTDRPFTPRARVVELAVPESASGARHVHVLVSDTPQDAAPNPAGPLAEGVGATRVLSSYDAGGRWRVSAPLTPTESTAEGACDNNHGCVLTVAPSDPRVLYLGLGPMTGFVPATLLRSADAGRTWEPRRAPDDYAASVAGTPGGVEVIEVDPLAPDVLWSKAGLRTFARSADGGRSWRYQSTGYDFRLPALSVHRTRGRQPSLVALHSGSTREQTVDHHSRSADGGRTWTAAAPAAVGLLDVEADAVAHGARADDVVVSTTRPAGLRGWSPRSGRYVDLDPAGLLRRHAPTGDVQATRERAPRFVLRGRRSLLVYAGPVGADLAARR